jgi:hypothetical protein
MATIQATTYQNPDGSPVANGFLLIGLNQAATSGGNAIGVSKVTVLLDANGTIIGTPEFASSSTLEPPTAYYILTIHAATGQQVSGPTILVI